MGSLNNFLPLSAPVASFQGISVLAPEYISFESLFLGLIRSSSGPFGMLIGHPVREMDELLVDTV